MSKYRSMAQKARDGASAAYQVIVVPQIEQLQSENERLRKIIEQVVNFYPEAEGSIPELAKYLEQQP